MLPKYFQILFATSELLSPGCGRACSAAQSGHYAKKIFKEQNADVTLLSAEEFLKGAKPFQIIHLIKSIFKFSYDIGVTVAGLWPCMFSSSIRALRQENF